MHPFYGRVTDRARRSLEFANILAMSKKHPLVTSLHVLYGILEEGKNVASTVLADMKVDVKKLKEEIEEKLGDGKYQTHDRAVCYDEDVRQLICDSITLGLKAQRVVGCHHLLQAMLANDVSPASRLLDKWKVTQELVDAHMGAVVKSVT